MKPKLQKHIQNLFYHSLIARLCYAKGFKKKFYSNSQVKVVENEEEEIRDTICQESGAAMRN